MRNELDREISPYLLQHRDNPVHWQPWGPAALKLARDQNRPILLSVGYAACHWCHVMAHESFEDPAIAAVMNELFVNIKVDREERPDIDSIYQSALALLGQQGGWPLTMFLTPEGEPFWGGTYYPSTARYGRPAFPEVLRQVSSVFHTQPDAVAKNTTALTGGLRQLAETGRPGRIVRQHLDEIAAGLLKNVDMIDGGTQSAPKFPQPFLFENLWRAFLRTGNPDYRQAVIVTLTHMCQGGIYDHLGGGFARYSTDDRWLAPHFEKMLYDNAQLLDLLTLVWQRERNPLFAQRVAETVGWLLREMIAPGGGFAATQDADSEGHEGKFYVWTADELQSLLGPDYKEFARLYEVSRIGNWEGQTILNRLDHLDWLGDAEETRLAAIRQRLRDARERRIKPGWDDKVLADWNGLMIAALARAAITFDRPDWLAAAEQAFDFVLRNLDVGGRLLHAFRAGKAQTPAMLEDYANMAAAALALFELTAKPAYLNQARLWVAALNAHFRDGANGGYFHTADDAEALIVRSRSVSDNAVPSGNGVMVGVLARLWHLTGDDAYRDQADHLVAAFAGEITRNYYPLSSWLNGFDLLTDPVQIVIVGPTAERAPFLRAAMGASLPNRILLQVARTSGLPASHPAFGKPDEKAAAFVCRGQTCSLPAADAAGLEALLTDANLS